MDRYTLNQEHSTLEFLSYLDESDEFSADERGRDHIEFDWSESHRPVDYSFGLLERASLIDEEDE